MRKERDASARGDEVIELIPAEVVVR